MPTQLARFTDHCVDLYQKAVVGDPDPPLEKSEGGYADWVIVALHCLREYLDHPVRRLPDVLQEILGILSRPGFSVDELPDFTRVCIRKQYLVMRIWRVLLRVSASLHELGEVQAIGATGFQRHEASRQYVIRVGSNFDDIKTTALLDCDSTAILDVYFSMKQPHDTQVGWQVLTRNLEQLDTVVADEGYDCDALRQELRSANVCPVIKHPSSTHLTRRTTLVTTKIRTTADHSSRRSSTH